MESILYNEEKKEYTNEFLSRMFAAHMPCDVYNSIYEKYYELKAVTITELLLCSKGGKSTQPYSFKGTLPILTPLSEISDEHAIEVAKMAMWHWDKAFDCAKETEADNVEHNEFGTHIDVSTRCFIGYVSIHDGCIFLSNSDTELEEPVMGQSRIIDHLRSLGYDMGFQHIPSLIDAGLAITTVKS